MKRPNLKLRLARLMGFSDSDIYFLHSLRHGHWLLRGLLPGSRKLPLQRLEIPPPQSPDETDYALARRIIAYYRLAAGEGHECAKRSAMWTRAIDTAQAPLVAALRAGDEARLAGLLCEFLRSQIVLGIDTGNTYTGRNWRTHSLKLLDGLVSLAEQLGVAPAESGQGPMAPALQDGPAALAAAIEEELGMPIGVPAIGSPYGLRLNGSFITTFSTEYVYVAWRIREAARRFVTNPGKLTCCEIGAGYGATALFLLQLMGDRIGRYDMIDLPETGCLQAYYLGKALGPDAISFLGEEPAGIIRILPPQALPAATRYDLVINQNSMPEFPADAARGYVRWIADRLDGIFYSYNHETLVPGGEFAITLVPGIVSETGGLTRLTRDLSWLRPGYVEETYAASSPDPDPPQRARLRR